MILIESESLDPYRNLAIEEFLLDRVSSMGPALFLWRSAPTVVIGKNQNPWRECHLPRMWADGVRLARRLSGGGAVYHDEGNLNYGLILPRTEYDEGHVFDVVLRALTALGLSAYKMNRNSLAVPEGKFSGTAFCFRRSGALHHGTLLVQADLERLQRYLEPLGSRIETRAIASVPARVTNLHPVTEQQLREALVQSVSEAWGRITDRQSDASIEAECLAPLHQQYVSEDWVWGLTPKFEIEIAVGEALLTLEIVKGRIVKVSSNADELQPCTATLEGDWFRLEPLRNALAALPGGEAWIKACSRFMI